MNADGYRETPRTLRSRFPYMFSGPNIGFAFYRGWMLILRNACEEIDALLGADKRHFHWIQIKEKLGTGRFYYHLDGGGGGVTVRVHDLTSSLPPQAPIVLEPAGQDEVVLKVSAIVQHAELATHSACIVCGATATPRAYDGYWVNVCALHQPASAKDDTWRIRVRQAYLGDDDE
ncbi:hypothetical protein [Variovorax rhizosphaerae]|uniref:Uncharacterized protein n=1 Tax=Variovorax rhizosphaerae TaxID=1836200 RepID=A0ABU8WTJ0_9BURK